jgi:hypothetical protein
MTILHNFVAAADGVAEAIQRYFASRDPNDLALGIEILQGEISALATEAQTPSIQETKVRLTQLTPPGLEQRFREDNALILDNNDYLATGPIESRKLIRVMAKGQPDDSVFLAKVTLINDSQLILAPIIDAAPAV